MNHFIDSLYESIWFIIIIDHFIEIIIVLNYSDRIGMFKDLQYCNKGENFTSFPQCE